MEVTEANGRSKSCSLDLNLVLEKCKAHGEMQSSCGVQQFLTYRAELQKGS